MDTYITLRRPIHTGSLMLSAALLLSTAHGFAQAVSGPLPRSEDAITSSEREVVQLNPFTVTAGEDRGYQAQSSLSASRLRTNLKDIASPTTAFTQEFLQDVAVTDTSELARFMLSTEFDYDEEGGGQNGLYNNARPLRMRGLAGGTLSINFFAVGDRSDTFSIERVDQTRGPNSILFGIGSPGGLINVTTKRANYDHVRGYVELQARRYDGLRKEIDINQPIVRDRVAMRFAAVDTKLDTWRNYEYKDEQRYFGTVRFRLGFRTELNVEAEKGDVDKQTKRTVTAYDAYTPWDNLGRNLSAKPSPALGIVGLGGASRIVYESASGSLMNWRNKTTSVQRRALDGELIPVTDFDLLPKETAIYGPGFPQITRYSRVSAYLTHSFTPQWNVELAAMRYSNHNDRTDPQVAAGRYLSVDTNPTLPTGAPNPNAGRTYFESYPHLNNSQTRDDVLRAIMSYEKDLGRWGRHRLAGVHEYYATDQDQQVLREHIVSPNAPNKVRPNHGQNRVWRRTYVDLNGPSNDIVMADWRLGDVTGLTEVLSGNTYETTFIPFNANTQSNRIEGTTVIGMLQSTLLNERIHTVVGAGHDKRTIYFSTQERTPLPGFKQGVLHPVKSDVGVENEADNVSFSAVGHVTPWLSLTYSKAQNSALPAFAGQLHTDTGRPPVPRGKSEDIGLKLDLFDHKVFITAQYFETSAKRDFDFGGVRAASINPIWNALDDAGVLAANGLLLQDVEDRTTGATFDTDTHGVEIELTANPTEHWRIFLNYSDTKTVRSNMGREMIDFVAATRDFWTEGDRARILLDGSGGLAPAARDNDGIIETVAEQVDALDEEIFVHYILSDGRPPIGQIKRKFNLRSTYEFSKGPLKGFSLGGGARYLSKPIIGFAATGTTVDDIVRDVFRGSEQVFVDFNVGYRRKVQVLGKSITWLLQLNVDNAFDNDAFVRLRQASDGTLTSYRFNSPREWILTSRFAF